MQLLFPGGSLDTAERLYRDTPTARFFNGLMAEVIAAAATRRLAARCASSRSAPAPAARRPMCCRASPRRTSSTPSPTSARSSSPGRASASADHPVHALRDARSRARPQAQGFGAGVVRHRHRVERHPRHRRPAPRRSRAFAACSRRAALLAMLEVTAPQRWFDLTVGPHRGLVGFQRIPTCAPTTPRCRASTGYSLLAECGFDALAACLKAAGTGRARACSRCCLPRGHAAAASAPRDWLLLADRRRGRRARARLRARGDRCTLVRTGEAYAMSGDKASHRARRRRRLPTRCSPICAQPAARCTARPRLVARHAAWERMTPAELVGARRPPAWRAPCCSRRRCVAGKPAPRLWLSRAAPSRPMPWMPRSPRASARSGASARRWRSSIPSCRCVCVDLDPAQAERPKLDALARRTGRGADTEAQVALRAGERRRRSAVAPASRFGAETAREPPTVAARAARCPARSTRFGAAAHRAARARPGRGRDRRRRDRPQLQGRAQRARHVSRRPRPARRRMRRPRGGGRRRRHACPPGDDGARRGRRQLRVARDGARGVRAAAARPA